MLKCFVQFAKLSETCLPANYLLLSKVNYLALDEEHLPCHRSDFFREILGLGNTRIYWIRSDL